MQAVVAVNTHAFTVIAFFFPAKTNRPRFHVLLFHRACMKHEIQQIAQSSCQNNSGIEMNDEDAKIETIRPVRIE